MRQGHREILLPEAHRTAIVPQHPDIRAILTAVRTDPRAATETVRTAIRVRKMTAVRTVNLLIVTRTDAVRTADSAVSVPETAADRPETVRTADIRVRETTAARIRTGTHAIEMVRAEVREEE